MRRLVSFIAILILLSTAAPLLACMTGSTMTVEENACCRAMHGDCGNMAKMGCCRTEIRSDEHPQLAVTAPSLDAHFAVIAWLPTVLTELRSFPLSLLEIPDEHSPPGLVTAQTTVLRI
jgi:hypothetical protein